jgi:Spy/CpxP family protein refolding chaperone
MLSKRVKISVISIVSIISYTIPSFADDSHSLPRPRVESAGSLVINWDQLNLTNSQKQRIKSLRYDFQKTSIKYKAQMDLQQLEIEKALVSPVSKPAEIKKLMLEKLSLESKLRMAALDNFLAIKSMLTTDQLAKLSKAVNLL